MLLPFGSKNSDDDDDESTKMFNREYLVLKDMHSNRNIIKLIAACRTPNFKALVFPYMAKGSLEKCLYNPDSDLCIIERVSICSDMAQGLAYLHHRSREPIIHCYLKPSNVLVNNDMTALISDFGFSRLVNNGCVYDRHSMEFQNSVEQFMEYIAPGTSYSDIVINAYTYIVQT